MCPGAEGAGQRPAQGWSTSEHLTRPCPKRRVLQHHAAPQASQSHQRGPTPPAGKVRPRPERSPSPRQWSSSVPAKLLRLGCSAFPLHRHPPPAHPAPTVPKRKSCQACWLAALTHSHCVRHGVNTCKGNRKATAKLWAKQGGPTVSQILPRREPSCESSACLK